MGAATAPPSKLQDDYAVLKTPQEDAKNRAAAFDRRFGAAPWSDKYHWAALLAQFVVIAAMISHWYCQIAFFSETYRIHLRKTFTEWWTLPTLPTFWLLFAILPLIISCLLVEFLKKFNIRRVSSKLALRIAMILRRKPRLGQRISYWSFGEWIFVFIVIIVGNSSVFYYCMNRHIPRVRNNLAKKGLPMKFNNYLEMFSFTMGFLCIYNLAFLFFPATRNCAWMEFFNISYANGIKYHRWIAVTTIFTAVVHCLGYYWLWIRQGNWAEQALPCYPCNITPKGPGYMAWFNFFGELSLFFFVAIGITSLPFVRRRFYEVFYYVHHLFVPAVIFAVMHWTPIIWWLMPNMLLYIVSRCVSTSNSFTPVPVKEFTALDNDIIKIVVGRSTLRDGHFRVGQFVYLNVPSISKLQWHAFTIASSPRTSSTTLTILAKSLGNWTKDLVEYADECKKQHVLPTVYMDAFYGASLEMYDEYNTLLLIGGGIGATPMFAILEDIVAKLSHGEALRQRVFFIFSFRELSLLEEIHPLLMKIKELDPEERYFTNRFYLTRPPTDEILDRQIDHARLAGQPHLQATKYDGKAKKTPVPFAEPLRSSTTRSMTYIALFAAGFISVVYLEWGRGKFNSKNRQYWPIQRFVEITMEFVVGIIVFVFIYIERLHMRRVASALDPHGAEFLATPLTAHGGHDVMTFRDLLNEYDVKVGSRPDIPALVSEAHAAHEAFSAAISHVQARTPIGVFISGPEALKTAMERVASTIGVAEFDIHEEEFEL